MFIQSKFIKLLFMNSYKVSHTYVNEVTTNLLMKVAIFFLNFSSEIHSNSSFCVAKYHIFVVYFISLFLRGFCIFQSLKKLDLVNIVCERGHYVNNFHLRLFSSTIHALKFHQNSGIFTHFALNYAS